MLDPAEAAAQNHALNMRIAKTINAEFEQADKDQVSITADRLAVFQRRITRLLAKPLDLADGLQEDAHWIRGRLIDAYRKLNRDDLALRSLRICSRATLPATTASG